MPYLQHCISETLRLYPAVPFNMRLALKDTTLPRGGGVDRLAPIGVKKDTVIGYSPLYLHRNPAQYPPVSAFSPPVMDFAPERWETWTPRPWQYIPFNGGPRICIGVSHVLKARAYEVNMRTATIRAYRDWLYDRSHTPTFREAGEVLGCCRRCAQVRDCSVAGAWCQSWLLQRQWQIVWTWPRSPLPSRDVYCGYGPALYILRSVPHVHRSLQKGSRPTATIHLTGT